MSETVGHFSLYGDFHADEVAEKLGLSSSNVHSKGMLWEGANGPSTVEELEFYCPDDLTMAEQVSFLLDLLWPVREALVPFAEQYTADFNIAGDEIVISLPADTLIKLAAMHVNLNCFFHSQGDHAN